MAQSDKNIITVDGVSYDVASGKVLSSNKRTNKRSSEAISKTTRIAKPSRDSSKPSRPLPTSLDRSDIIELPKPRFKLRSRQKNKSRSKVKDSTNHSLLWYFFKPYTPSGFSSLSWLVGMLRSLLNPLLWLLVAIPVIVVELQNLALFNLNDLLSKIHTYASTNKVFSYLTSLVVITGIIMTAIFARMLLNEAGLFLRARLSLRNTAGFRSAVRVVFNQSAKLVSYGLVQFVGWVVILVTGATISFWLASSQPNTTVGAFAPYFIGLLVFVGVIVLAFWQSIYWIRLNLTSIDLGAKHKYRLALAGIANFPVKSVLVSLVDICLYIAVILYALWAASVEMGWLSLGTTEVAWYVLLIASIIMLAVVVGFIQQNIWSGYSLWLREQFRPALARPITQREIAKLTTWQIWLCVYLLLMTIAICSLLIVFALPTINSAAIWFSSHLPSKIEVPLK